VRIDPGRPGAPLAPRNRSSWRPWLGLEHATCYNASNHWNALTDGVTFKYIFNAQFAEEQLPVAMILILQMPFRLNALLCTGHSHGPDSHSAYGYALPFFVP